MARAHDARGKDPSGVRVGAPYGNTSKPTPEELAIRNQSETSRGIARRTPTGRGNTYGMTTEEALQASSLMDLSSISSPLAGLPTAASVGEFATAKSILSNSGATGNWNDYWSDKQAGYRYQNLAANPVTKGGRGTREPAPISVVPTSTSNPARPRTVAAGYDDVREVLTVVFRDGTFYNYYGVDQPTWDGFKSAHSKGPYIETFLDGKDRGTASMKGTAVKSREQLYRVARTGQLTNKGKTQYDRSTATTHTPRINPVASIPKIPGV